MTAEPPDVDGTQPCATGDPDRFHPHPNTAARTMAKVAAECKPCPFLAPCREYALHTRVLGIWGGTTDDDRVAIRRKQHIVPEPLTTYNVAGVAFGPKPKPREELPPCGTIGGYYVHKRRKEVTCAACRAEHAAERAQRRNDGKAAS